MAKNYSIDLSDELSKKSKELIEKMEEKAELDDYIKKLYDEGKSSENAQRSLKEEMNALMVNKVVSLSDAYTYHENIEKARKFETEIENREPEYNKAIELYEEKLKEIEDLRNQIYDIEKSLMDNEKINYFELPMGKAVVETGTIPNQIDNISISNCRIIDSKGFFVLESAIPTFLSAPSSKRKSKEKSAFSRLEELVQEMKKEEEENIDKYMNFANNEPVIETTNQEEQISSLPEANNQINIQLDNPQTEVYEEPIVQEPINNGKSNEQSNQFVTLSDIGINQNNDEEEDSYQNDNSINTVTSIRIINYKPSDKIDSLISKTSRTSREKLETTINKIWEGYYQPVHIVTDLSNTLMDGNSSKIADNISNISSIDKDNNVQDKISASEFLNPNSQTSQTKQVA